MAKKVPYAENRWESGKVLEEGTYTHLLVTGRNKMWSWVVSMTHSNCTHT